MLGRKKNDDDDKPQIGDLVGGYRLEQELGEGGMGLVFRAIRESDGMEVAIKLVKGNFARDEEYLRRFKREARAAAEIQHENLTGVVEAGEDDGRHFIAMRYVPGRSLDERIQAEGVLPIADTLRIAAHVGAGLDALHQAGMVHRDVKASNIMLDPEGGAHLTDFGLAKGSQYSALTRPGQIVGTLDYIAPEIIRGEEPGPPADIYALGCVIYECLAGRPPFGHLSGFQVGMAHLDEVPPDPLELRDDSPPPDLGDAVQMALKKDPSARPPTATAFARFLQVAARGAA